jgi:hypothetical protein
VYLTFANGSELDITRQSFMGQSVQFSSDNEGVAWVEQDGMVYANEYGKAVVTARILLWSAQSLIEVWGY